jgi:hypothetical protein
VNDRIQGWASILLGAAVVVFVGWLTIDQMSRSHVRRELDGGSAQAAASASAAASAAGTAASSGPSTTSTSTTTSEMSTDAGFSLGSLNTLLGDGGAMPTGAPRAVRLGVVLVQFAGAEGASSSARAKPDALKHAQTLAEQARTDWKAAVKAGDSGSSEDIGRIPRGVLDARTEVAVFSLAKDDISEPLETPRGYWIVKRVE